MTNAELITALRCESVINDEHPRCESCKYGVVVCHGSREDVYGCDSRRIENDAADALEAAENRIEELEAQMPKEGEWIWDSDTGTYHCSECNATSPQEDQDGEYIDCPKYCQNCGAIMDGKEIVDG